MKRLLSIISFIGILGFAGYAFSAPTTTYQVNLFPQANNTYDLGTTTLKWRNVVTQNLTVNGTCIGCGGNASSTPGGLPTEIQYNNAGAFGGVTNFTFSGNSLFYTPTTSVITDYSAYTLGLTVTPTAESTSTYSGLNYAITNSGAGFNLTGAMYGINGLTVVDSAGFNVTKASGALLASGITAGTVTDLNGFEASISAAGGTTTNAYGGRIRSFTGGGAITNAYGLRIDPPGYGTLQRTLSVGEGRSNVEGTLYVGGAGQSINSQLYVTAAATETTKYGTISNIFPSPSTDVTGVNYIGNGGAAFPDNIFGQILEGANYNGYVAGFSGFSYISSGLHIDTTYGLYGNVVTADPLSDVTNLAAIGGTVFIQDGTVTNAIGIWSRPFLYTAGTVTNAYGAKIEPPGIGTNRWTIASTGGNNYFVGSSTFGAASVPNYKVDVQGTLGVTGTSTLASTTAQNFLSVLGSNTQSMLSVVSSSVIISAGQFNNKALTTLGNVSSSGFLYIDTNVDGMPAGLVVHDQGQVISAQIASNGSLLLSNGASQTVTSTLTSNSFNFAATSANPSGVFSINSSGNTSVSGTMKIYGATTLGNITGSTQCLHVDTNGLITGTGTDCGSGGGGGGGVGTSTANYFTYYNSINTVTGTSALQLSASGLTITNATSTNFASTGLSVSGTSTLNIINSYSSAGTLFKSSSGSNIALFGAGGGQSVAFYDGGSFTGNLSVGGASHGGANLEVQGTTNDGSTDVYHGHNASGTPTFTVSTNGSITASGTLRILGQSTLAGLTATNATTTNLAVTGSLNLTGATISGLSVNQLANTSSIAYLVGRPTQTFTGLNIFTASTTLATTTFNGSIDATNYLFGTDTGNVVSNNYFKTYIKSQANDSDIFIGLRNSIDLSQIPGGAANNITIGLMAANYNSASLYDNRTSTNMLGTYNEIQISNGAHTDNGIVVGANFFVDGSPTSSANEIALFGNLNTTDVSTGNVGTAYGLHLLPITGATNNWGLGIETSYNFLKGSTVFGASSTPVFTVDVKGTLGVSGTSTFSNNIYSLSTDGGVLGNTFDFYQNSASPARGDAFGQINFYGNNASSTKKLYGFISGSPDINSTFDPISSTTTLGSVNIGVYDYLNATTSVNASFGVNYATLGDGNDYYYIYPKDFDLYLKGAADGYGVNLIGSNGTSANSTGGNIGITTGNATNGAAHGGDFVVTVGSGVGGARSGLFDINLAFTGLVSSTGKIRIHRDTNSFVDLNVNNITNNSQPQIGFPNASGTLALAISTSTASIGGSALVAGECATATTTAVGATTAMAVSISPVTYPGENYVWKSYVSAADTVVAKVCAITNGTPTASVYNLRIIK